MTLRGSQVISIQHALLDAFSRTELEQLTRLHLDVRLETIVEGRDLTETVFRLIEWADQRGRIKELVEGAQERNQSNPTLAALVKTMDDWLELQPAAEGKSPYQGLNYYDVGDADRFHGREDLVAELVTYLHDHCFLAVIGASGGGKSSLVRAGLVPALLQANPLSNGVLPPEGCERWPIHIITPKSHPLKELAASLTQDNESDLDRARLIDELSQDARVLDLRVSRILQGMNADRLVLIVDQFEELFTLCRDPNERYSFISNLLAAATEGGVTTVVLTLRADFYHRCDDPPQLRAVLQNNQVYIGQMSRDELQTAIEKPAHENGWELEEGLVNLLLDDVTDESGALPLLSHALLETWQRRSGITMTLAGYAASGRVKGAIAQSAEAVFKQRLTTEQQSIARNIFVRLTQLGEGVPDTRRRVAFDELIPKDERASQVEAVLKTLADARLITTDRDSSSGQEEAEVAHEALIQEWDTLREWLEDDREGLRIHRHLTEAAQDWETMNHETSELYRGTRLDRALAWAGSHAGELNRQEEAFLKSSLAERQRRIDEQEKVRQQALEDARALAAAAEEQRKTEAARRQEAEARRQVEAEASARLRNRAWQLSGLAAVAIVFALLAWQFGIRANHNASAAEQQRQQAEEQRDEAQRLRQVSLAQGLAAQSLSKGQVPLKLDELSALLARQAYLFDKRSDGQAESQVDNALRTILSSQYFSHILTDNRSEVHAVAYSPDSQTVASAGCDQFAEDQLRCQHGYIRLTDLARSQHEPRYLDGHDDNVLSVVFSHDGHWLASGGADNQILLWPLDQPKASPLPLAGHEGAVLALAYSPDGKWLASASQDKTIRLWDLENPSVPARVLDEQKQEVTSVAFSPDGEILASGSRDKTIKLWDLRNLQNEPLSLQGGRDGVTSVSFSPDGNYLASGSRDMRVRVWDLHDIEAEPILLDAHSGEVNAVAFSADGQWLASGSEDKLIRLWRTSQLDAAPTVLQGHSHWVTSVAFSPDGNTLASASRDLTARIWELREFGVSPLVLKGHEDEVTTVDFAPDDQTLASGSRDRSIRIWDLDRPEASTAILKGHTDNIRTLAFSPDGNLLASGSRDSTIRLWDLTDPAKEPIVLEGHNAEVRSVEFGPEGDILASAARDAEVRLWHVGTGKPLYFPLGGHDLTVTSVAFDGTGQFLASGSHDETIQVRSLEALEEDPIILKGHIDHVNSIDASPDEALIVSGGQDKTVRVWDMMTGEQVIPPLVGHVDRVLSVAFNPDGDKLASGGEDQSVNVWNWREPDRGPLMILSGHKLGVRSVAFDSRGERLASGSKDKTVIVWRIDDTQQLADRVCDVVWRNLTEAEWNEFVGSDIPYETTCEGLPKHP